MSSSLDIGAVLRRTFGVYAAQAPVLLAAALLGAGVLALDEALRVRATVLGATAGLVDLLALGVFVGVVVLVEGGGGAVASGVCCAVRGRRSAGCCWPVWSLSW